MANTVASTSAGFNEYRPLSGRVSVIRSCWLRAASGTSIRGEKNTPARLRYQSVMLSVAWAGTRKVWKSVFDPGPIWSLIAWNRPLGGAGMRHPLGEMRA